MAVSYRIVIALAAIVLLGVLYGALDSMAVEDTIEPQVNNSTNTTEGEQLERTGNAIWGLLPVFGLLAIAAWLLRQALFVQP